MTSTTSLLDRANLNRDAREIARGLEGPTMASGFWNMARPKLWVLTMGG